MADLLDHIAPTDVVPAGHYGIAATGVTVTLVETAGIASISGGAAALDASCRARFGIGLPTGPRYVETSEIAFAGLAPGRWIALGMADPEAVLGAALGPSAAICDQSDAYVLFEVAGPEARAALAKGVAVDLDPAAFRPGDVATTSVALIGATLWLADTAPTFRIAVGRSFAPSFSRFLVASAAEFGCAVMVSTKSGRG